MISSRRYVTDAFASIDEDSILVDSDRHAMPNQRGFLTEEGDNPTSLPNLKHVSFFPMIFF